MHGHVLDALTSGTVTYVCSIYLSITACKLTFAAASDRFSEAAFFQQSHEYIFSFDLVRLSVVSFVRSSVIVSEVSLFVRYSAPTTKDSISLMKMCSLQVVSRPSVYKNSCAVFLRDVRSSGCRVVN
jgi:hypothetical protein